MFHWYLLRVFIVANLIRLFFLAAGVVIEEKNWPDFFPLIHHDIPNEIPIHLQKIQYVAFTTLLGKSKATLRPVQSSVNKQTKTIEH